MHNLIKVCIRKINEIDMVQIINNNKNNILKMMLFLFLERKKVDISPDISTC